MVDGSAAAAGDGVVVASASCGEGEGVRVYQPDHVDADEVRLLRDALVARRKGLGLTRNGLALSSGMSVDTVMRLEASPKNQCFLSTFQQWARVLGLRLEVGLDNFWMHSWSDQDMLAWYAMSRLWSGDDMLRLWLVSALRCWRLRSGVDAGVVAAGLGSSVAGMWRWEADAHDPVLFRAMLQARVTGTRLRLSVWEQEDWSFR